MRALDEEALICDFAQYYNIYDFDTLPLNMQAILASGLPTESRIKKTAADMKFDINTLLLAAILDQLRLSNYRGTKDAKHKRNAPESILEKLTRKEEKEEDLKVFKTSDDFKKRWKYLQGRG